MGKIIQEEEMAGLIVFPDSGRDIDKFDDGSNQHNVKKNRMRRKTEERMGRNDIACIADTIAGGSRIES